jgi:hypothetical protein
VGSEPVPKNEPIKQARRCRRLRKQFNVSSSGQAQQSVHPLVSERCRTAYSSAPASETAPERETVFIIVPKEHLVIENAAGDPSPDNTSRAAPESSSSSVSLDRAGQNSTSVVETESFVDKLLTGFRRFHQGFADMWKGSLRRQPQESEQVVTTTATTNSTTEAPALPLPLEDPTIPKEDPAARPVVPWQLAEVASQVLYRHCTQR